MKKFAKLTALVLALVLVLSLAACKGTEKTAAQLPEATTEAAPVQEASVVGKWAYSIDAARMMEIAGQQEDADEDQIEMVGQLLGDTELVVTLELNEDNTFRLAIDPDSIQAMVDNMIENLPQLIAEMYGMTPEELESMLAEQNMTMDDFAAMMREQINPEDLVSDIEEVNGYYQVDGDKIYLGNSLEEIDQDKYVVFTLTDSKLTITEVVGAEDDDLGNFEQMLPVEFTRVG